MSMSLSDDTDALSEVKLEKDDPLQTTDQVAGSSSTPPSSPPLLKEESLPKANPRPSQSQSLEAMSSDPEKVVDSSATAMGDSDGTASQGKPNVEDTNSSQTEVPFSTAQSTLPPSAPAVGSMLPPPQKLVRSGNGSQKARSQAGQSENVSQKTNEKLNSDTRDHETTSKGDESPEPSFSGEPSDEITGFDWMDLEQRYHTKMNQLAGEQQEIMTDFSSLCNYFAIWAQAGSHREIDRSHKRLKTQMTLVDHHETELEEKRQHYIKVVDAFKTVALLFSDSDFADVADQREKRAAHSKASTRVRSKSHTASSKYLHCNIRGPQVVMSSNDLHPARCVIL